MPRQLQKCLFRNINNFNRVGPRGQGVEPPVRKKLGLAVGMGGIRLGKVR
jgi:hypothetical protein